MLPVFAHHFCPHLVPNTKPKSSQIRYALLLFDSLISRWKELLTKRFFSYNYLLEKILEKVGLKQYTIFIKHLVCKKRRRYYESYLEKLGGLTTKRLLERAELIGARKFLKSHHTPGMPVNCRQHGSNLHADSDRSSCVSLEQLPSEHAHGGMLNISALRAGRIFAKHHQPSHEREVDLYEHPNLKGLLRLALKTSS